MSDAVVAIVSIFFFIGITVGIVVVIALPDLRPRRRGWPGRRLEYRSSDQPPGHSWDEGAPDGHPRWPGDDDNDLGGR